MVKYDDWDTVIASPEYKPIGDRWASRGNAVPFDYCRSFNPVFCCRPEGRTAESHHVMGS
jgi:hypothetical protein